VVNGHFQSAHGKFAGGGFKTVTIAIPGCRVQRFNICVGNHPEDVKKWIQERKRRFPRRQQKTDSKKQTASDKQETKTESALGSLLEGYGSSSSEDDNNKKLAAQHSKASDGTKKTTNAAAGEEGSHLVGTDAAVSQAEPSPTRPPNYRTRPCKYFMRNGSCRNGDNCNFSHEIQNQQQKRERSNPRTRRQRGSSSSTTLLRKLLENDARREATLSIQLLEYLVDCNYLQKQRSDHENKGP